MTRILKSIFILGIGVACLIYFTIPNVKNFHYAEKTAVYSAPAETGSLDKSNKRVYTKYRGERRTFRYEREPTIFEKFERYLQVATNIVGTVFPLISVFISVRIWVRRRREA